MTDTTKATEGAAAKVEAKVKEGVDKATNMLAAILAPLVTLVVVGGAALAGLAWILNSKLAGSILDALGALLEFSGVAGLKGVKEFRDHVWPHVQQFWAKLPNGKKSYRKAKKGWWWLKHKTIATIVVLLSTMLCLLLLSLAVFLFGWMAAAAWLIMLAAVFPFVAGSIIQIAYGQKHKLAGLALARPFVATAIALVFIATAIMALPTSLRNASVVTMIVAAVYLGTTYLLLIGRKSNRLYNALKIIGITMVVLAILFGHVIPFFPATQSALDEGKARTESWWNSIATRAHNDQWQDAVVTATEGAVLLDSKEYSKELATLHKGDRVRVKPATISIPPYPAFYWEAVTIDKGKTDKAGIIASDVVGPVILPTDKPAPVVSAVAPTSPASVPAASAAAPAPPAPTPVVPAAVSAVSAKPEPSVENFSGRLTTEWQDTGIVLKPGDFAIWGSKDPATGWINSVSEDILNRCEVIYSVPDMPFRDRSFAFQPFFNLSETKSDNGKQVNFGTGSCHVKDANSMSNHLYARIKAGEPAEIYIKVKRGGSTTLAKGA